MIDLEKEIERKEGKVMRGESGHLRQTGRNGCQSFQGLQISIGSHLRFVMKVDPCRSHGKLFQWKNDIKLNFN